MFDLVGKKRYYFILSAFFTIPGLIFILLGGLKPSADFTGGTIWQAKYANNPSVLQVQAALDELGHPEAQVRALDDGYLEIQTRPIDLLTAATPEPVPSGSIEPTPTGAVTSPAPVPTATPTPTPSPTPVAAGSPAASPGVGAPIPENTEFASLQAELVSRFGPMEGGKPRLERTIGPTIGSELVRSSILLIIVGELFILGYLWVRFGFRFGTCAIIALLHDVVVVVGTFAILGYFFGVEFDALFVTALLTIIGFSVHDTIVVFDRIRENRIRHAGEPFGAIVNHSILQTIGRSINTSLTVLVTLGALVLLGPPTIREFTLALLLGVVSGTYSSIFNASQLLVAWNEWDARRKAAAGNVRQVRPLSR